MHATTLEHSSGASRWAAPLGAAALAALAIGVAGCSSTASPPGASTSSPSTTTSTSSATAEPTTATGGPTISTSVEVGNTVIYAYVGQTATISCEDGKSLNVTGSDNTLTVNGSCETVSVGGTKNKITLDRVNNRITVIGMDNTVTYKDGDPKVDELGPNNTVTKGG